MKEGSHNPIQTVVNKRNERKKERWRTIKRQKKEREKESICAQTK
jgi:hypothetical protein